MNTFLDFKIQTIISILHIEYMQKILKYSYVPVSKSYENEKWVETCLSYSNLEDLEGL